MFSIHKFITLCSIYTILLLYVQYTQICYFMFSIHKFVTLCSIYTTGMTRLKNGNVAILIHGFNLKSLSEGCNRNIRTIIFAWAILVLNNVRRKTTQSEKHLDTNTLTQRT